MKTSLFKVINPSVPLAVVNVRYPFKFTAAFSANSTMHRGVSDLRVVLGNDKFVELSLRACSLEGV